MTDWRGLESVSFGDSPELADELAARVLAGTKTATSSAFSDGPSTEVRKANGDAGQSRRPLAVIETVELTQRPFNGVDAAFAYDEGEGDRSLAYWQRAPRRYFTRVGQFAGDMLLYWERFQVAEGIERAGEG